MQPIPLNHPSDDPPRTDEFLLPDELIKIPRPHPRRQRSLAIQYRFSSIIEQRHDRTLNHFWTSPRFGAPPPSFRRTPESRGAVQRGNAHDLAVNPPSARLSNRSLVRKVRRLSV